MARKGSWYELVFWTVDLFERYSYVRGNYSTLTSALVTIRTACGTCTNVPGNVWHPHCTVLVNVWYEARIKPFVGCLFEIEVKG